MTVLSELAGRGRDTATRAGADTLAAVGRQVLDTVACAASGAGHPLAARWTPLLPRRGEVSSLAAGPGWDLATAVEIDATLSHVDEFDPLHAAAAVAPGAVVVPAALAVGAGTGAAGEHTARAIVAGYEVAVEAALRFGGAGLYRRGWWPTALFGALGAAAATAWLLDLDQDTTTTALAMAAAPLGGLLSAGTLGDAHYLLTGRAAGHGCWAAHAARHGLAASHGLLDDPAGAALGRPAGPPTDAPWPHVRTTAVKRWPCARPLHAALAALADLADAGIRPAPGDTVTIGLPVAAGRFVTDRTDPATPTDAAASVVVAVAGALAGRAGDPTWYREWTAGTHATAEVRLRLDPALDEFFPRHWAAEVAVGRHPAHRVVVAPGDHERPLPDEELRNKAARLLGGPASPRDRLLDRVLALDAEPDVAALHAELCRTAATGG